jgi:uncharacterized protein (TIGR02145 family)
MHQRLKYPMNKQLHLIFAVFVLFSCTKKKNEDNTTPLPCESTPWNSVISYSTLKDIDGNNYKTVTIGTQTWMAENLKTMRYSNGDSLYFYKENSEQSSWDGIVLGAVRLPHLSSNTDILSAATKDYSKCYGNYYNYYAVMDKRNVCPVGWHVSTAQDWQNLKQYTDSTVLISGFYQIIKSQNGWVAAEGTDNVGLRLLPSMNTSVPFSGTRSQIFDAWCFDSTEVFSFQTQSGFSFDKIIFTSSPKSIGKSIRCVKN